MKTAFGALAVDKSPNHVQGLGAMITASTRILGLPLLRPATACALVLLTIILILPL